MSSVATVKIVGKDGDFIIINKCDYDENTHILYDDKPKKTRKPKKLKITDTKQGD